jgi:alpha-D-xyloside xylohydrolase
MLVRDGAAIPHIALAQSTAFLDWSKLDLNVFASTASRATGLVALPDGELQQLALARRGSALVLENAPLAGKVTWTVVRRRAAPTGTGRTQLPD